MSMSFQSRQEYLNVMRKRYRQVSSREEKSRLIDEAVDTLGYHRKSLIRELNRSVSRKTIKQKRVKPLKYQAALPAIELVWEALDYPCAERLHPVLATTAQRLAAFGELPLSTEVLSQLQQISRPTLGRYLKRLESPKATRRIPRKKPSPIASVIPVDRYDWDEQRPGALEIDLVEHNGGNTHGHYGYTLTVVDIVSGYSHRRAVLGRAQAVVLGALHHILSDWPFEPWGLHSDNGNEFLNDQLYRFCQSEKITFTRSQPYRKNDNAHVEQKNKQFVREFVGYDRYDTPEDIDWLNDVYMHLDLYANMVLPMRKVISKERIGKKIRKRYDTARTPLTRLIEAGVMTSEMSQRLKEIEQYLNPLELHRTIENLLAEGPAKLMERESIPN